MENNKCSIGKYNNDECYGKLIECKDFSDEVRITLNARSGVVVSFLCEKHDKQFRVNYILHQQVCADPFTIHVNKVRKSLKVVNFEFYNKLKVIAPSIAPGNKLCISCSKKIINELDVESELVVNNSAKSHNTSKIIASSDQEETPILTQSSQEITSYNLSEKLHLSNVLSPSTSEICSSISETFTPNEIHLDRLNTVAEMFRLSPMKTKDLERSKTYARQKYHDITAQLQSSFQHVTDINFDTINGDNSIFDGNPELTGKEMLMQLKNKFDNTSKSSEKLQILSVLPSSWSTEKISNIFGASAYMVKKVKQKVIQDGVLFIPEKSKGHPLFKTTEEKIQEFFRNQDISRELPGKKEFKSVYENGKRVQKQKRLILGNLNEIFHLFKEKYPFEKVGFSKFASLRPRECVLAGASGTHVVCVCLIHENFKLLFYGARLEKLKLEDGSQPFSSYRDCMGIVICEPPTNDCYFGSCSDCPGSTKLRNILENLFMDNFLDDITYSQWTQVDRCSLETTIKSTEDYIDFFVEYIPKLLQHDFVAKQQAEYFQTIKKNLEIGQVLVVADFSENYSFLLQNSVQGAYWNNRQATIHPFACYYRSFSDNESKIVPLNLVIISDNLTHNTTAVYSFQGILTSFLKNKIPDISKIFYFSDGAAAQYKNRYNLVNLLHHEEDFEIPAEWHFFATSHGKGPSDGLGGTVKRLVSRANLTLTADQQIQTPNQLYRWAEENIQGINISFVSDEQIRRAENKLKYRFKNALPVQGIRRCHAAVPISNDFIKIKTLSSFKEGEDIRLRNTEDNEEFVDEPEIKTR